ncbi:MAG: Hsp20/alpha crystallin family protein [Anaerolineales bacterium]|nr:Hsp20/alpha crystallin family protein [Anaerolineales bacterium]
MVHMIVQPHRMRMMEQPTGFNGGRRYPMDIRSEEDEFVLTAALPGIRSEDLNIEIKEDILSLRAQAAPAEEGEQTHYLLKEIQGMDLDRKFRLPDPVKADKAEARMENGLLTLRIPKAEEARPRQIKVKTI